jgi:hypothetical protein
MDWTEIFKYKPTAESIEKLPFFSGMTVSELVNFHSGYKTYTAANQLNLPSILSSIIAKDKKIRSLGDLLLTPYYRFLYFPWMDRKIIADSQTLVMNYILQSTLIPDEVHRDKISNRIWVIDANGEPAQRQIRPFAQISTGQEYHRIEELSTQHDFDVHGLDNRNGQPAVEQISTLVRKSVQKENQREKELSPEENLKEVSEKEIRTSSDWNRIVAESAFFIGERGSVIKTSSILDISIENMYDLFPVRFRNCLRQLSGMKTLIDLLNTDWKKILRMRNIGVRSIRDARIAILTYVPNAKPGTIVVVEHSPGNRHPFFGGTPIQTPSLADKKMGSLLRDLEFPVRFANYLRKHREIVTVRDLLEIPVKQLLFERNLGRVTIAKAQEILKIFIENGQTSIEGGIDSSSLDQDASFDELIVSRIKTLIRKERDFKILLDRFSYGVGHKRTLQQIAADHHLTRERIRQIAERGERKIAHAKRIFAELVHFIKEQGIIVETKNLLETLIRLGKWAKENERFYYEITKKYISRYGSLTIRGSFIVSSSKKVLKEQLIEIERSIADIVGQKKEPVKIESLIGDF